MNKEELIGLVKECVSDIDVFDKYTLWLRYTILYKNELVFKAFIDSIKDLDENSRGFEELAQLVWYLKEKIERQESD